jgi:hypothetical protein
MTGNDGTYGEATVLFDKVVYLCGSFQGERPEKIAKWHQLILDLARKLGGVIGWCYSRICGEWSERLLYWLPVFALGNGIVSRFVKVICGRYWAGFVLPGRGRHWYYPAKG